MKIKFISITTLLLFSASTLTFAHTTVVRKNTPSKFAQRIELEGSSGVFNAFSISHGCATPHSQTSNPVKSQSVVFPNGADSLSRRADTGEFIILSEHIIGNPIMSPKPVQDYSIFADIAVRKSVVPSYDSHGIKTHDVRAFHFLNGRLQKDLIGVVPFRASFPKFKPESCATILNLQIAIANYCTRSRYKDNRADIWIGELTEKFNDPDVVSVGFWPSMSVVRDHENNPLPDHCQQGYEITVTPSSTAIDRFLPVPGFWPSK